MVGNLNLTGNLTATNLTATSFETYTGKRLDNVEETASYIIYKDGTTIYAKNGTTGKIDFSGTDAYIVIQSAINATSSLTTIGSVLITRGEYEPNRALTMPVIAEGDKKGFVLRGEGDGATVLSFSGNDGALIFGGTSHVTVRDLLIRAYYSNVPAINITGSSYNRIEDVTVRGTGALASSPSAPYGLFLDGSHTNQFSNNRYLISKGWGIQIGNTTCGASASNGNVFVGVVVQWNQGGGVNINSGTSNKFLACDVEANNNAANTAGIGIQLENCARANVISGCYFEGDVTSEILLNGTGNVNSNVIRDNYANPQLDVNHAGKFVYLISATNTTIASNTEFNANTSSVRIDSGVIGTQFQHNSFSKGISDSGSGTINIDDLQKYTELSTPLSVGHNGNVTTDTGCAYADLGTLINPNIKRALVQATIKYYVSPGAGYYAAVYVANPGVTYNTSNGYPEVILTSNDPSNMWKGQQFIVGVDALKRICYRVYPSGVGWNVAAQVFINGYWS